MTLEMTPLASAAAQGNIAMVELLVENRADVNSASTVRIPSKHTPNEYTYTCMYIIIMHSEVLMLFSCFVY